MARKRLIGFNQVKKEVSKTQSSLRSARSCKSCTYYYDTPDEDIETCHNNAVTEFDYIQEDNKSYCCFWSPIWNEK